MMIILFQTTDLNPFLLFAVGAAFFLLSVSFLAASDLPLPLPPLLDDFFALSSLSSFSFSYFRFAF